jgi:hypothetical protein
MPYWSILICIAFAIFFYRVAEAEDESVLIWCGLSVVISVAAFFWWHWGWLGCSLGQVGLFVGITVVRMFRKP